jgi:hypothetical protein
MVAEALACQNPRHRLALHVCGTLWAVDNATMSNEMLKKSQNTYAVWQKNTLNKLTKTSRPGAGG